jgi:hypothetical protein
MKSANKSVEFVAYALSLDIFFVDKMGQAHLHSKTRQNVVNNDMIVDTSSLLTPKWGKKLSTFFYIIDIIVIYP